jgi:hypothetical protein
VSIAFSASLGGNDGDLDQQAQIGELGLDAGAAAKQHSLAVHALSLRGKT